MNLFWRKPPPLLTDVETYMRENLAAWGEDPNTWRIRLDRWRANRPPGKDHIFDWYRWERERLNG